MSDIESKIDELRDLYGKPDCTIRIDSTADGWQIWVDYDSDDTGEVLSDRHPTLAEALADAQSSVKAYLKEWACLDMSRQTSREAKKAAWPEYVAYHDAGGEQNFWPWFYDRQRSAE